MNKTSNAPVDPILVKAREILAATIKEATSAWRKELTPSAVSEKSSKCSGVLMSMISQSCITKDIAQNIAKLVSAVIEEPVVLDEDPKRPAYLVALTLGKKIAVVHNEDYVLVASEKAWLGPEYRTHRKDKDTFARNDDEYTLASDEEIDTWASKMPLEAFEHYRTLSFAWIQAMTVLGALKVPQRETTP